MFIPKELECYNKLVRIEDLAEILDVSVRRMRQLQQEGVITPVPEKKKGERHSEGSRYDYLESMLNLILYYRIKSGIW
jgi:DNA-binding transcriptional MerR regulator